jgi:hypothetical protein
MKPFLVSSGILAAIGFAQPVKAAVSFFVDNPGGFNTAIGGLVLRGTETWEQSTLAANNITTFSDPLAPGVLNGPFPTGSTAAAGITAQANTLGANAVTPSPAGANGLATASVGFVGSPSDQLSPNSFNVSFDLIVNPAGNYAGAVRLSPLYFSSVATSSTSTPGTVIITVYDPSNNLLGTQTVTNVDYSQTDFVGIVATAGSNIRRINLFASTNAATSTAGADDISVYGVPEPSGMALLSLGAALVLRRKRSGGRRTNC